MGTSDSVWALSKQELLALCYSNFNLRKQTLDSLLKVIVYSTSCKKVVLMQQYTYCDTSPRCAISGISLNLDILELRTLYSLVCLAIT